MMERWKLLREAAESYANKGWYVFPVHGIRGDGSCTCDKRNCGDVGKHPATKWKLCATCDPRRLDEWWDKGSQYNIGIATGKLSGITVVDIDAGHGGLEAWQQICDRIEVPDTYTVKTGGGGYHLYFKYQPALKTATNVLGPGIDIRNDGGFVVAPPSSHRSGSLYSVDQEGELAELPAELLTVANAKPPRTSKNKELTPERARLLLKYIDNQDYTTWFKVGIILGRAFDRNEVGWEIYQEWSDRDWDGRDAGRLQKMRSAYFNVSSQSNEGAELSTDALFSWARKGGWSDVKMSFSIDLFCYLANENAFVFLPNGDKWLTAGVDSTIAPVPNDLGEMLKPSKWLILNRAAACLVSTGELPAGLIEGVCCTEGNVYPLENSRLVNIFSSGQVKPMAWLVPPKTVNLARAARKYEQGDVTDEVGAETEALILASLQQGTS